MRKAIKITILLILALAQSLTGQANICFDSVGEKNSTVKLNYGGSRPRGEVFIPTCYYLYIGNIQIIAESNISEISATVIRLDDNQQWNGLATGSELTFVVSTDPGTYYLEMILSDGSVFYGEYTL